MQINNYDVEHTKEGNVDRYSYFACTCEGDDKRFWNEALSAHLPSALDPVSSLIMEISHLHRAWVGSIGCDMWFGFTVSKSYGEWINGKYEEERSVEIEIQCDLICHGLLAAVMIFEKLEEQENDDQDQRN